MRLPLSLASVLLSSFALAGCPSRAPAEAPASAPGSGEGSSPAAAAPAPAPQQVLTVYCGRNEAMVAPLIERFGAESGVQVRVNYADSGQLAATIVEEGARSPADVFFAQDSSTLGFLERNGALGELPADVLGRVPERLRAASGRWVGTSGRARVVTYNTTAVTPADLPATLAGYTDPRWRGRVGWSPENASFQSFLTAMVQLEGAEPATAWVRGMVENGARAYPSNTPGVAAVAAGEIDVMLTNHYYLHRIKAERGADTPIANHFASDGTAASLVNVSGVAILGTNDAGDAARAFVEFLLSEDAQRHFAEQTFEFPVVEGIAPSEGLAPITSLNVPAVDLSNLGNLEQAVQILQQAGAL